MYNGWPTLLFVCTSTSDRFIWFVFLLASQGETPGLQVASVDCRSAS